MKRYFYSFNHLNPLIQLYKYYWKTDFWITNKIIDRLQRYSNIKKTKLFQAPIESKLYTFHLMVELKEDFLEKKKIEIFFTFPITRESFNLIVNGMNKIGPDRYKLKNILFSMAQFGSALINQFWNCIKTILKIIFLVPKIPIW